VIVTCRPVWEGGLFAGSEDERRRLLGEALALGAEYVDIEWRAGFADLLAQTHGKRVVLSTHDFEGVPKDLSDRARAMSATNAEFVKIAVRANRLSDCLALLALQESLPNQQKAILIAMGDCGLASRVLAERFGSSWTYAGDMAAVGQVTMDALLNLYRFRSLSAGSDVYGVVGRPVGHSVSPAMHNAGFAEIGHNAVYLPLPAADIEDFVTFGRGIGLKGASVTIPYKVPALTIVDHADALARQVGAVNTIRVVDGLWNGYNTDVSGFLRPLSERGVDVSGARAAVLGAGGSARAVASALLRAGADVTIHARRETAATELAECCGARVAPWPPAQGSWDVLVNCTPVGMHPAVEESPMPSKALTGGLIYDLVYNPSETRLLREGAAAGCRTIGGLDMLVAQAQEQFQLWTGHSVTAGVMRAAAEKQLSELGCQ
jgi:3-dehydroquinate dehydratase/shikimate dehydrogenase